MQVSDLWDNVIQSELQRGHFFGRPLVTIPSADFAQYKKEFDASFNPLNTKQNYRSRHTFRHIHAVAEGDFVQVHIDYFNPEANKFLAVPHLFVSVIPYFIWHLITLSRPYTTH